MDDMISVVITGALIPLVALTFKSIINLLFKNKRKELIFKSRDGKIKKFMVSASASESDVAAILKSELHYEKLVKNSIDSYIKRHKELKIEFKEGKSIDFLIESRDLKIGIEAKDSIENFNTQWLKNYFEDNSSIDEVIFIINNDIPEKLRDEVENLKSVYRLKCIPSPRGKNLSKHIEKTLNKEFYKKK